MNTNQNRPAKQLRAATALPDELGKQVINDCLLLNESTVEEVFRHRQGRGDLTSLRKIAHHPAHHLLKQFATRGAPVLLRTPPWTQGRKDAAMQRGPHKSAYEYQDFLRSELLDMVRTTIAPPSTPWRRPCDPSRVVFF
jgi:hypothetical protein